MYKKSGLKYSLKLMGVGDQIYNIWLKKMRYKNRIGQIRDLKMYKFNNLLYLEFNVSKIPIKNDWGTRMDLVYVPMRFLKNCSLKFGCILIP